jgi:hypothetical protein
MALKFRRKQKLFPGVFLNFSATGISATVGIKGLSVDLNKNGAFLNTGIPGTGIYDRNKIAGWNDNNSNSDSKNLNNPPVLNENYYLPKNLQNEIQSKNANSVTSINLSAVKETLTAAYIEKQEIENEIDEIKKKVIIANILKIISFIAIVGFFINWFKENCQTKKDYLEDLKKQLSECEVNINMNIEKGFEQKYKDLCSYFENLSKSKIIWDKTSAIINTDDRSSANHSIKRVQTFISYKKINFINANYEAFYFKNQNGSDLYIYPGFAVLYDNKNNFGLVELSDLKITYTNFKFQEEETIPSDAVIIGETWAKVNYNGTPDKRFKNNYKIPIVSYGEIEFKSNTGIYEVFIFSNAESTRAFCSSFETYLKSISTTIGIKNNKLPIVSNGTLKQYKSNKQEITKKSFRR